LFQSQTRNFPNFRDLFIFFVDFFVFVLDSKRNVGKSIKPTSQLIVVRNIGFFADFVPFLNQIEGLFAGDHNGEFFKELFVELIRILGGVFINPLIFASGVHGFQSFEYGLASFFAKVVIGDKEVGLEVFFSDKGVIVDGYIDTGEDEVFGKFGIDSIGRSYEDSKGKQSESMRGNVPFLGFDTNESLPVKSFSFFFSQRGLLVHFLGKLNKSIFRILKLLIRSGTIKGFCYKN
jgi:hypothetical protein